MATNTKLAPSEHTNGLLTGQGVNRKRQKRRTKSAAKLPHQQTAAPISQTPSHDEDRSGYGDEDYGYSDGEMEDMQNVDAGYSVAPSAVARKKNKKKGKRISQDHEHPNSAALPAMRSLPNTGAVHRNTHHSNNIWNTSTQQERQNIKEFWLSLNEEERKSLLKIEKEAVLRKMKQQQKHSCSCTVCGRKRTAIEEELEVLYEGYYEELEQYAHHDHPPLPSVNGSLPDPLRHRPRLLNAPAPPPPQINSQHRSSHLHEHLEEEEFSEDEEYSEEDDEDYTDEEPEPPRGVPDFLNFGQNLTVKDNLLTVADDLLKNDGRKFIEMMEQLAERRMQRESEAEYAAAHPNHSAPYPPNGAPYNVDDPSAVGEEYDDEEGSFDSQEEYEDDLEEEDDMGGLTEEQRMQEGRRMFQIFAARMFEQRVLTAYREKVAAERQKKLLEELEDETKLEAQRAAKKERDAQKKKDKKKQQQQAKAEEKARKDAEKAAEEAKLREVDEQKQEELRRKREEQKKRKEEEKRKEVEDRARKEAEKAKRALEEQQRREEAERKAREQKAVEKARKDELKKREREEREAREKEIREKRAHDEKLRKEHDLRAKSTDQVRTRDAQAQTTSANPQIQKRPSQAGMVAVPGLQPAKTSTTLTSPRPVVATPALQKNTIPAKASPPVPINPRGASPRESLEQSARPHSKQTSPRGSSHSQPPIHPTRTIMQKPATPALPPPSQAPGGLAPLGVMQGPPGMPNPQMPLPGFGMPPMGYPGLPGPPGPMMHNNANLRNSPNIHAYQGPPMGMPNRMNFGPSMNGAPHHPPGMLLPHGRNMGFPFDNPSHPPPGFIQHQLASPVIPSSDVQRSNLTTHSRQASTSEKERFETAVNQPIARPAPIKRPGSGKTVGLGLDESAPEVDDLADHLGSSALLADDDEPLPSSAADARRSSNIPVGARGSNAGLAQLGAFPTQAGGFSTSVQSWASPTIGFGSGPSLGQQTWGSLPGPGMHTMGGWLPGAAPFGGNAGFGGIGSGPIRSGGPGLARPLTIRLALCQACKQLSEMSVGSDGYHNVHDLLRRIELNRPQLDALPTLKELEEICETEGDSQNGGGELSVQKTSKEGFAIKWRPDARSLAEQSRGASGLGEIGSPIPSKTSPAEFGAPGMGRLGGFQSIGTVGPVTYL